MGVVVADRAVHLAEQGRRRELLALSLQPCHEHRELLAQRRGRGGLPVGMTEHCALRVTSGQFAYRVDELIH